MPPGRRKVGFLALEGPFLLQSTITITVRRVSPQALLDSRVELGITEMQQGGAVPLARDDSSH